MEIYLDNSATTRCYREVGELVMQEMCIRDSFHRYLDYGDGGICFGSLVVI